MVCQACGLCAGGMAEPFLADALTEADLLRSQHDESGNLEEPAQVLPGRSDRQPAYPASMESMLAVGTHCLMYLGPAHCSLFQDLCQHAS